MSESVFVCMCNCEGLWIPADREPWYNIWPRALWFVLKGVRARSFIRCTIRFHCQVHHYHHRRGEKYRIKILRRKKNAQPTRTNSLYNNNRNFSRSGRNLKN